MALLMMPLIAAAQPTPSLRASTPEEQALDAAAFEGLDQRIRERAHPPLQLVVAVTSAVSPGSQQRGQALELIRGPLFESANKRIAGSGR